MVAKTKKICNLLRSLVRPDRDPEVQIVETPEASAAKAEQPEQEPQSEPQPSHITPTSTISSIKQDSNKPSLRTSTSTISSIKQDSNKMGAKKKTSKKEEEHSVSTEPAKKQYRKKKAPSSSKDRDSTKKSITESKKEEEHTLSTEPVKKQDRKKKAPPSSKDRDSTKNSSTESTTSGSSSSSCPDTVATQIGSHQKELARLVEDCSSNTIPKEKAEKAIVQLLLSDVWNNDEKIVECALKLINIILEREPSVRETMVSFGGHSVMLGLMKKWKSSAEIQAQGCHFIAKCSQDNNKEFADAALKYGALPKIQKALIKFPKCSMVQTAACQAMEQLLLTCTSRQEIVDSIDIALVIAAMQRLTVTVPLQKAGTGILEILADDKEAEIVKGGGMEPLAAAYQRFSDAADVEHVVIRQHCRNTIPKLLSEAQQQQDEQPKDKVPASPVTQQQQDEQPKDEVPASPVTTPMAVAESSGCAAFFLCD